MNSIKDQKKILIKKSFVRLDLNVPLKKWGQLPTKQE